MPRGYKYKVPDAPSIKKIKLNASIKNNTLALYLFFIDLILYIFLGTSNNIGVTKIQTTAK